VYNEFGMVTSGWSMFLYNSRSYSPRTILAIPKPASPSTNTTMKQQQAESINNTVNHMVELFMCFFYINV